MFLPLRTGAYLVSGHQTGAVSVWDVAEATGEDSTVGSGGGDGRGCATDDLCGNAQQVAASVSFLAHQDCVNSIRWDVCVCEGTDMLAMAAFLIAWILCVNYYLAW